MDEKGEITYRKSLSGIVQPILYAMFVVQMYQTYQHEYSAYLYFTGVLGILVTRVAVGYEKILLYVLNGAVAIIRKKDDEEVGKTKDESLIGVREDEKDDGES